MRTTFKNRALALLLTLCMVFSLCGVFTTDASAASTNTGARHTVCTALSPDAEAYYTGEYDWDSLSQVSGVSTGSSLAAMDGALYSELQELMSDTMTSSVTYKSLTSYWPSTDCSATTGQLLFYSDYDTQSSVNREHVWPKSRASFYQKNGGSDLHHLRPADSTINSTRSNYTMGDVVDVLSTYSTKDYAGKTVLWYNASADLVEVNDDIKGDVARVLLYVYVRWGQPNLCENVASTSLPEFDSDDSANNGLKVIEDLDTLLEWCKEDPVDTWEMSRNDCIEDIQGNRNVFIDYPEYAWLLFGREVPEDMTTPSDEGTVVPPAPVPAIVSFSAPEAVSPISTTVGASVTLPGCEAAVEGYTFAGWTAAAVAETTAKPVLYAAGSKYTVRGDTKLYALYTRSEATPGGTGGSAVLVTQEPADWSGSYVIAAAASSPAMMTNESGGSYLKHTAAVLDESSITNSDAKSVFTLSKVGSYYTIQDSTGAYLMCSSVKSISLDSSKTSVAASDTAYLWSVSCSGIAHYSSACGYLQYNASSPRFTTYLASSRQMDVGLYRVGAGSTTYYATFGDDSAHTHSYTSVVTAPTCTQRGYTTHTCSCGSSYVDSYVEAAGHKTEVINARAAACTEDGYTGDTVCSVCGETVSAGKTIPALGHDYVDYKCSRCGEKTSPFTDVSVSDYYYDSVIWAVLNNVTNGKTETTFEPASSCTRAQVVTFLWRANGCPEPKSTHCDFTDVSDGAYYRKAVLLAVENGIANGYDKYNFGPDDTITRAQAVTFLWRAEGGPSSAQSITFKDVLPGAYYYNAVRWAVERGITGGYDKSTFAPGDGCTRAQIVTFLYRDKAL